MIDFNPKALVLLCAVLVAMPSFAADRVASVAESPSSAETGANGDHGMLVDLIHALDRETHSSTSIVLRPFARSLQETAAGHADFHIPFIQNGNSPAPSGLSYVQDVDFGQVHFVIYSSKSRPFNAASIASARTIETEPGHESFFPFAVTVTHCVPCSLQKVGLGRTDALIVPSDIVDFLLSDPKYRAIHRAYYKSFPVRALVPANVDSSATRRYLSEGARRLRETGEIWRITHHNVPYSDWQP